MMEKLGRDSYAVGVIMGIVIPVVIFGIISTPDSTTKLVVVTTNEELVIATDTYNLL